MKELIRFSAILMTVALIASGTLAWLNKVTLPRKLAQQEKELNQGLMAVLPGSESGVIEPVSDGDQVLYYKGFRDADKTDFIGYALLTVSRGYSSNIRALVGVDTAFSVLAIKVLYQGETPGLGTRCEEIKSGESSPWWQDQFKGQPSEGLAVDKDGGTIQSITGATITSRAITNGLSQSVIWLREQVEQPAE